MDDIYAKIDDPTANIPSWLRETYSPRQTNNVESQETGKQLNNDSHNDIVDERWKISDTYASNVSALGETSENLPAKKLYLSEGEVSVCSHDFKRVDSKSMRFENQQRSLQRLKDSVKTGDRLTSKPFAEIAIAADVTPSASRSIATADIYRKSPHGEASLSSVDMLCTQRLRNIGARLSSGSASLDAGKPPLPDAGHRVVTPPNIEEKSHATTGDQDSRRASLEDLANLRLADMSVSAWPTIGDRLIQRKSDSWGLSPSASARSCAFEDVGEAVSRKNSFSVRDMWAEARRSSAIPLSRDEGQRASGSGKNLTDIFTKESFDELLLQVRTGSKASSCIGTKGSAASSTATLPFTREESAKQIAPSVRVMMGASGRSALPPPPDFDPPVYRRPAAALHT